MATLQVVGHGLAQFGDAGPRRVPVLALGEGSLPRLDDVVGRGEVWLTDPEIDDRATLGGEPVRPRQHLERRFSAETPGGGSWKDHGQPPNPAIRFGIEGTPQLGAKALIVS